MHASLDSGAFCVVCGRFDRELVQRRSGLKCVTCVGRRSNKGYVELQHQQATYMLSLNLPRQGGGGGVGAGLPSPRGNGAGSCSGTNVGSSTVTAAGYHRQPRASIDLYGSGLASSFSGTRPLSPLSAAANGALLHQQPQPPSPSPQPQANLNFDIDDLAVAVEDAVTQNIESERSVLHATITTSEVATTYLFTTRDRASGGEIAARRHRFKEAVRVFEALKLIGGTALPEIPEKRLFSRFDPKFIEERRAQMEAFLAAVMANHFLVRHPQLLGFLGLEGVVREQQRALMDARAGEKNGMLLGGGTMSFRGGLTAVLQQSAVGGPGSEGPALELPSGELARCRLGTMLGKGAYGSVYLGLLHSSSQLVAVKVVHVGQEVVTSRIMALHQELELLRNLQHPNVVRFHGALWSEERKELSIFTEYIECGSIANMIHKFGPLPMPVIQRYLFQTLRGLEYLHSLGIAHRDIKGSNLLCTKAGLVKLADFGCSGHLDALNAGGDGGGGGGGGGELAGTPMWMAPEAMRGEAATTASDIWSVGCVGIEMLQRRIWEIGDRENMYTAMFRIQKAGTPPTGLPPASETHPLFHGFLCQCLAVEPDVRPSAAQLLQHPFFQVDLEEDDGSPLSSAAVSTSASASASAGRRGFLGTEDDDGGGGPAAAAAGPELCRASSSPRSATSPALSPRAGQLL